MTKIAKRTLLLICSCLFAFCLGFTALTMTNSYSSKVKAETQANFVQTLNGGVWSDGVWSTSHKTLFLQFDTALAPTTTSIQGNGTANSSGDVATSVTINGATAIGSKINFYLNTFYTAEGTNTTVLEVLFTNYTTISTGDVLGIPEGTAFGDVILPAVWLQFDGTSTWVACEPNTIPSANYQGIATGYNMTSPTTGRYYLGLQFDKALSTAEDTNLFDGDNTLNIYIDGIALENGNYFSPRCYHNIKDYTIMELLFKSNYNYASGYTLQNGSKLEIKDSTVNNYPLEDVTLYYNSETAQWQDTDPTIATYLGIADGWNMGTPSDTTRRVLGLLFDKPLATAQNSNLFSGNTLNIYLDGVAVNSTNLSPRCYYFVADYNRLELMFRNFSPAGTTTGTYAEGVTLQNGTKLEITDSVVNGYTLPNIVLYFNADTQQWQETAPIQEPTVSFVQVAEKNNEEWVSGSGWTATYLQFDGTFTESTSCDGAGITYTVDGVTKNFDAYWVTGSYASTNTILLLNNDAATAAIADGAVLHIEEGFSFQGQILPEVTLYMVNGNWQTDKCTVSFTGVRSDQNNVAWESSPTSHTATYLVFEGATFAEVMGDSSTSGATGIYWINAGETEKNYFDHYWVTGSADTIKLLNAVANTIPDGATLHVEFETEFQGEVLPKVTLTMAYGKWWLEVPSEATFSSIDSGNNNVTGYTSGYNMVRIAFTASASTTGITAASTYDLGNALQLNGTPVNDLGWLISHSATSAKINFEYVSLPEFSNDVKQIKLELTETTVFGDIAIQPFTVYFNGETWQTGVYSNVSTANFVTTDGVWGAGYGNDGQKMLNLEFDIALAPDSTDIHGNDGTYAASYSGNLMSQMTIAGKNVTFGSQIIVFVELFVTDSGNSKTLEIMFVNSSYENLVHGDCLHIPAGTLFGDVALGEVNVYYSASTDTWQTTKPAPLVAEFTTEEGASIRINASDSVTGLRFETHIGYESFNSLLNTYGAENIQLGTYIIPAVLFNQYGGTLEDYISANASGTGYITINTWNDNSNRHGFVNYETAEADGYYTYYGTISNVKSQNYLQNFIGVGYLIITDSDGTTYSYLTHDGSWSRNAYEVAKSAYVDTANIAESSLPALKVYLDKVIVIDSGTKNGSADINDNSDFSGNRTYTRTEDYTVSADASTGVVTIVNNNTEYLVGILYNGKYVGYIANGATKYADLYALTPSLVETAEETTSFNFGFAEPNQELYGELVVEGYNKTWSAPINSGSTASNIAQVTAEFDGNSARIWFQTMDVCWPNNADSFEFTSGAIPALKSVINDFRAQGVTNISLMCGTPNYRTTKNYYVSSTKTWYSFWDVLNDSTITYDDMNPTMVILSDEDDYAEYIALQKTYFTALATELGDTVTAIEILNEMEGATSSYRYYYENGYLPDIDLVAQAAMDICKAATEGVREAGTNIKIAMPALMTVSELTDSSGKVIRYASDKFLTAEYDYIESVGGNPDDYFQIINMHPYVVLSSDTSTTNYLYYENNGLTRQTPAQIQERWIAYMETIRKIAIDNGDAEKPVWITEFGMADYVQCSNTSITTSKWSDYRDNKVLRQAQVYQAIYDAMVTLPYIDSVFFFRLGDYAHTDDHSYAVCGEASYGIINSAGALKEFGKYLYAIANGVNVFTDTLDDGYTSIKSIDALGTINGKTIAELESNVNAIY